MKVEFVHRIEQIGVSFAVFPLPGDDQMCHLPNGETVLFR